MSTWAEEEFGGAALGDRRLNRRLIKLTSRFADKPTASIPDACADWAETMEAAAELIDWYRCRWEIKTFFKVLKNGCRVEALQLGSIAKIELALAVYMVVAWRLARLVRLGRTHPVLEATALFTPEEWKGTYLLAKKPVPAAPPTIREVTRQITMLGGFHGRKGDGEPGVKTL